MESVDREKQNKTLPDIAREALDLLDFDAIEEEASVVALARSTEVESSCPRFYL
jgi:hypothetical protein